MPPSRIFPPVEFCRGTNPSQAANSSSPIVVISLMDGSRFWVFGGYTNCGDPSCALFVTVPADGLNVRTIPNGPAVLSLVNGTPLVVVQRQGDWTLVAPRCNLAPTGLWSWTGGVPLSGCL